MVNYIPSGSSSRRPSPWSASERLTNSFGQFGSPVERMEISARFAPKDLYPRRLSAVFTRAELACHSCKFQRDYVRVVPPINQSFLLHLADQFARRTAARAIQFARVSKTIRRRKSQSEEALARETIRDRRERVGACLRVECVYIYIFMPP